MTDTHPLTQAILEHVDTKHDMVDTEAIDTLIREYVTPPTLVAESGVRFPDHPSVPVEIAGNFIQSGHQMQMALIGTEPVLLVQPEYDAEEERITLITTAVDLPPAGLLHVLGVLTDGVKTIVEVQAQQQAEQDEADAGLREASDAFDEFVEPDPEVEKRVAERARALQSEGPDEYPTGFYEHLAREQIASEDLD